MKTLRTRYRMYHEDPTYFPKRNSNVKRSVLRGTTRGVSRNVYALYNNNDNIIIVIIAVLWAQRAHRFSGFARDTSSRLEQRMSVRNKPRRRTYCNDNTICNTIALSLRLTTVCFRAHYHGFTDPLTGEGFFFLTSRIYGRTLRYCGESRRRRVTFAAKR